MDRVASEPLLLLDDLGAERPTEWALAGCGKNAFRGH